MNQLPVMSKYHHSPQLYFLLIQNHTWVKGSIYTFGNSKLTKTSVLIWRVPCNKLQTCATLGLNLSPMLEENNELKIMN